MPNNELRWHSIPCVGSDQKLLAIWCSLLGIGLLLLLLLLLLLAVGRSFLLLLLP